jgi:hypothetical protein
MLTRIASLVLIIPLTAANTQDSDGNTVHKAFTTAAVEL